MEERIEEEEFAFILLETFSFVVLIILFSDLISHDVLENIFR